MEYPCGVPNLNFLIIVFKNLPVATPSLSLINTSILPSLPFPLPTLWEVNASFFSSCIVIFRCGVLYHIAYFYHVSGMTFPGVSQNIFRFTVALNIMITIIMLEDKVIAILLQFSHTVITSMELTRLYHHSGITFCCINTWMVFPNVILICYTLFVTGI